jgi:menaquinone-specific isochorismate synthase
LTSPLTGLTATTVPLPGPPDLLAEAGSTGFVFSGDHGGLAGRGVAARIELPDGLSDPEALAAVTAQLGAIDGDDRVGGPGTGPVAVGALPFDPKAPGSLVVPARIYGRSGDRGWMTTISAGDEPLSAPGEPPDEFRMSASMPHAEWKALVAAALEEIDRGDMRKVVLARRIDIEANRPFVVPDVLERLQALYPSCMIFHVDGFLGASPELLISRTGDRVESHPLAGTVARSGDVHGDEILVAGLMGSDKTRREHRLVVEAIAAALGPVCTTLDVPEVPSVMGLRNVSHLATHLTGRLATAVSALELVARIHPTPAVGGSPTDAAVRYLQKAEGFDRGRYTGPVGWMDSRGDGCFALGIRCASVDGHRASIYAGNGIVAGSDPADELAETQLKLQALLAALVRP